MDKKQKDSIFYFGVKPKVRGEKKTKQQHPRIVEAVNFFNMLYGNFLAQLIAKRHLLCYNTS